MTDTKTRRYSPLRVISRDGRDVTDEKVPATAEEVENFIREIPTAREPRSVHGGLSLREGYTTDATWGEVVKDFRSLSVQHRNALEDTADDLIRGLYTKPRFKAGSRFSRNYRRPSDDTEWNFCHFFGRDSWRARGFSIVLALASGMRVVWRPKNQRLALAKLAKNTGKVRDNHLFSVLDRASRGESYRYVGYTTGWYGSGNIMALAKAGVVDVVGNLRCADAEVPHNQIVSPHRETQDGTHHEIETVSIDLDALMLLLEMRGLKEKALLRLLED